MEGSYPSTYRDTERCENCYWHEEQYKFGNLLFICRKHDFQHQNEEEMMAAVCDDWERE